MISQYIGIPVSATHCNIGALLGLTLAARFQIVNDVYHEKRVKAEHKLNKSVMIKIVSWWVLTVPFVLGCSMLLTYLLS